MQVCDKNATNVHVVASEAGPDFGLCFMIERLHVQINHRLKSVPLC
jgi:hypothetical protein